jgi:hypothetical protein
MEGEAAMTDEVDAVGTADGEDDEEIEAILRELDEAGRKYRARDEALRRKIVVSLIRRMALLDHLARLNGRPPIRWPDELLEL